jgi:hypothetical protein
MRRPWAMLVNDLVFAVRAWQPLRSSRPPGRILGAMAHGVNSFAPMQGATDRNHRNDPHRGQGREALVFAGPAVASKA